MSSPAQIIPGVVSEVRAFTAAIDMFEHAIERRLGLSRTDLRCVQALAATGTLTPAEVSQASGCSLEAVTRALARLEAGRYVDCRSGRSVWR
jgi:DNA-binding MarR family transcriptional regulator